MYCCGSVICVMCRRDSANCPVCGSNVTRRRRHPTPAEDQHRDQLLLEQLHQHATKGSASAQYQLGTHYAFANGGYGDTPAALLWYERAARQGHAGAQFSMARNSTERNLNSRTSLAEPSTWRCPPHLHESFRGD